MAASSMVRVTPAVAGGNPRGLLPDLPKYCTAEQKASVSWTRTHSNCKGDDSRVKIFQHKFSGLIFFIWHRNIILVSEFLFTHPLRGDNQPQR